MSFKDRSGGKHTNYDSFKRSENSLSAKMPQKPASPAQGEPAGDGDADDAPEQVAATHGPAVEVTVSHDHAGNRHTVHSTHQDGHEYNSEHASVGEAHNAARMLSGDSGGGM